MEYFSLARNETGWHLRGTIVGEFDGRPTRIRYEVACDSVWKARSVHVGMRRGTSEEAIHLVIRENGAWTVNNRPHDELSGRLDVDLDATPATAISPIRRMAPLDGTIATFDTASIRAPQLDVAPTSQRYTKISDRTFTREIEGEAAIVIEVDELGIPIRYGATWVSVTSYSVPT